MSHITCLLIDLDDTLYPQADFLDQAWTAVADHAARLALDAARLETALRTIAQAGSAQGRIINQALAKLGVDDSNAALLVAAFSNFRPCRLTPYVGVDAALERLKVHTPLALITDGNPAQQRAKLLATGLADYFDVVVCSDDGGRAFRKPHERPFGRGLESLKASAHNAVMVGDSPHKDILGANRLGMRTIRVRTGEYAAVDSNATLTVASFADVPDAIDRLRSNVELRRSA